jgi:hypothetical protein
MGFSKAKLQTWLDKALRHIAPKSPQHIHIDQLGASEATGKAANFTPWRGP